jgi:hypothetical protein
VYLQNKRNLNSQLQSYMAFAHGKLFHWENTRVNFYIRVSRSFGEACMNIKHCAIDCAAELLLYSRVLRFGTTRAVVYKAHQPVADDFLGSRS